MNSRDIARFSIRIPRVGYFAILLRLEIDPPKACSYCLISNSIQVELLYAKEQITNFNLRSSGSTKNGYDRLIEGKF